MRKNILDESEKIPQNLRLAYKDYPVAGMPQGLIRMLQNHANDPADDELWNEINDFMERDLDAEDQTQTTN